MLHSDLRASLPGAVERKPVPDDHGSILFPDGFLASAGAVPLGNYTKQLPHDSGVSYLPDLLGIF
jgi:hypothetical protein